MHTSLGLIRCLLGCRKLCPVAKFGGLAQCWRSRLVSPCCGCSLVYVVRPICLAIECRGPVLSSTGVGSALLTALEAFCSDRWKGPMLLFLHFLNTQGIFIVVPACSRTPSVAICEPQHLTFLHSPQCRIHKFSINSWFL